MKPITKDGINYTIRDCVIRALHHKEIIKPGDYIRNIVEDGESGGFDTTYKDPRWLGTHWHRVENDFTHWIGQSYQDYLKLAKCKSEHEIIRIQERY